MFADTNVIVSGVYSSRGKPAQILDLHAAGRIQLVISESVLAEAGIAIRRKLPSAMPALVAFLTSDDGPEIVADPPVNVIARIAPTINDKDAVIVAAAVQAEADWFVSGDRALVSELVASSLAISGVNPADLLKGLGL